MSTSARWSLWLGVAAAVCALPLCVMGFLDVRDDRYMLPVLMTAGVFLLAQPLALAAVIVGIRSLRRAPAPLAWVGAGLGALTLVPGVVLLVRAFW